MRYRSSFTVGHLPNPGIQSNTEAHICPMIAFVFDFIIMTLTVLGLLQQKAAHPSSLWRRLYQQGILYWVGTSILNLPLLVSECATSDEEL